jgi:hypothetical protein
MGLLDKALNERKAGHPESRAGLFAKALISLDRNEREVSPEREVETIPPLPAPEAYPLGVEDLAALEAELKSLSPGPDGLLLAFQRLCEALPLAGLALFTARDGAFRPAARFGFKVEEDGRIEERALAEALKDPSALNQAALALLSFPDAAERCALRAERSEGEGSPLWIYADPRLDSSSPGLRDAVAGLFRSIPAGGPDPCQTFPLDQLSSLLGEGYATAFCFDCSVGAGAEESVPSLSGYGKAAALLSAAGLILGAGGKALLVGDCSVLAILYSNQSVDEELALFQFRKSLARALPSLQSSELPKGRALGVDSHAPEAGESLERFASR